MHPTTVDMTVLRATAPVAVRIRPTAGTGGSNWMASVGLPPGLAFVIDHVDTGERVTSGHVDAHGDCFVPAQDALIVGEQYALIVGESSVVRGGSATFTLTAPSGATPLFEVSSNSPSKQKGRPGSPCVAELFLERATVDTFLQLQPSRALGAEHWGVELGIPPTVLRVLHTQTKGFVCHATTDDHGFAHLSQSHALFIGESYTVEGAGAEGIQGAEGVRVEAVQFIARPPAPDPATGQLQPQLVQLSFERVTNDVTLVVKVRTERLRTATSIALAPPAGLRYTIVHKLLNKEVASGVTDQVGKSVIKRRGTLFVGETYVARTPGGPGISAGEASFTVDGGASSARGFEVVVEVVRASNSSWRSWTRSTGRARCRSPSASALKSCTVSPRSSCTPEPLPTARAPSTARQPTCTWARTFGSVCQSPTCSMRRPLDSRRLWARRRRWCCALLVPSRR